MKYAKKEMVALGIACSLLLHTSVISTTIAGPGIPNPQMSQLRGAISRDDVEKVRDIITQNQIDIHGELLAGNTPLHRAARFGCTRVIQLLLELGADVNVKSRFGHTALHDAARSGHMDVVQLLLEKGAIADASDGDGVTPLDMAIKANKNEAAQALIKFSTERVTRELHSLQEKEAQIIARRKSNLQKDFRPLLCSMTAKQLRVQQVFINLLSRFDNATLWNVAPRLIQAPLERVTKQDADFISQAPTTFQRRIREQITQEVRKEVPETMATMIRQVMEERGIRPLELDQYSLELDPNSWTSLPQELRDALDDLLQDIAPTQNECSGCRSQALHG